MQRIGEGINVLLKRLLTHFGQGQALMQDNMIGGSVECQRGALCFLPQQVCRQQLLKQATVALTAAAVQREQMDRALADWKRVLEP